MAVRPKVSRQNGFTSKKSHAKTAARLNGHVHISYSLICGLIYTCIYYVEL